MPAPAPHPSRHPHARADELDHAALIDLVGDLEARLEAERRERYHMEETLSLAYQGLVRELMASNAELTQELSALRGALHQSPREQSPNGSPADQGLRKNASGKCMEHDQHARWTTDDDTDEDDDAEVPGRKPRGEEQRASSSGERKLTSLDLSLD